MYISYVFLSVLSSVASDKKCAHIAFPSIPDNILRETEDTLVNFTFKVNITTAGCWNLSGITIDKNATPICKVHLDSNSCISNYIMCGCTVTNEIFWFSKILDISDNVTWKWRAFNEYLHGVEQQLIFIIERKKTSDSKITSSIINGMIGSIVLAAAGTAIAIFVNRRKRLKTACEFPEDAVFRTENEISSDWEVIHINNIYIGSDDFVKLSDL